MFGASLSRLLPASLALIPLIITPGLFFYFDVTPRIIFLLFVTAFALCFTNPASLQWSALTNIRVGRWLMLLMTAECVAVLVSTVFAGDLALAVTGGSWRRLGAVASIGAIVFTILLAGEMATRPGSVQTVLKCVSVGCFLASCYGIAQYFGADPFLPAQAYRSGEGIYTIVRPPSTMGHADYFAAYLAYAVFFPVALLLTDIRGVWKAIAIAAFGAGSAAIVLSGTRAGILGWLFGVVMVLLWGTSKWRRRGMIFVFSLAALIAILALTPAGQLLRARVHWSLDDAAGGGRFFLWRDSVRLFLDHPFVGIGPDAFSRVFPKYRSLELAQRLPDFYQESPHNLFLDAAVSQGLPGALLSIATVALGFFAAARARAAHPGLSLGLGAALAAGTLCGMFSSPVFVTSTYQFAVVAILCAIAPASSHIQVRYFSSLRILYWFLAGIFLLWSGALAASDLLAGSFRRAIQSGNIPSAAHFYDVLTASSLPGFQVDLYASRAFTRASINEAHLLQRLQAWPEALRAADRATISAEDRQNAFLNRASLRASLEDAAGAEHNLRLAIAEAPNWFKPHWLLAQLLARTGRSVEAREEARLAMSYDAGKDAEVVSTWRSLGSPR